MKLTNLGMAVNEIGRAREIIGIIVKYGFGEWISKNGMGRYLVTKKRYAKIGKYNRWERIRLAIEELGPTFIKFGQILADRIDIIPDELREELKKLQDEADPMPDDLAIEALEVELGRPISDVFREFDRQHLASASVAQTYKATLLNGEEVCVKIQRPGIDKKVGLDLQLMHYFAIRMQKNNPEMEAMNVVGLVKEFGQTITYELNFRHEAGNVIRFRHNFENDPDVFVPRVYMEFTTDKLLVEEFIRGVKVSDLDTLLRTGNDPVILARRSVRLVFSQIFDHGFFHADPHPGNLFVLEGNIIAFIDFGMMGSLRQEHLQFLGKYVMGYIKRDAKQITEALLLFSGKRKFNRFKELEFQIDDMLAHYKYLSVDEMNFGKVMNESVDIIVKFGLRIPSGIYLLVKSLITIERVAVTLYPEIDFAREMQPFALELLKKQYNPKRIAEEVFDALSEYYKLIKDFPSDINDIIYKIKEGQFKTQIEIKGFEPLVEHIDRASNRVAIAIVVAALIIGASLISQWEHTKLVGMIVFMLAGFFGFWLLVKLFRKNRF
ncbi:MAG: AarF/ABC1/UbiB kinase family protein [Bacteroidetes bacterium]|nr:AarF/ABC1/UbiB kinase family protein [Bacteroidota bacterium]